jgi:hypothetical protein
MFLDPKKCGLPGLFKGENATEYLEHFEECCALYAITKDVN